MSIVEELKRDRESGARRLEAEYKAGLLILASRLYSDVSDAEELVNRVFAEVVEGIDGFLEQSSLFTWMCRIMNNLYAMDRRRKSDKTVVYSGDLPETPDENAADAVYRAIDASILSDAIHALPKDMRDVIVMHFLMEQPVAKVAKFRQPASASRRHGSRLHERRNALRYRFRACRCHGRGPRSSGRFPF